MFILVNKRNNCNLKLTKNQMKFKQYLNLLYMNAYLVYLGLLLDQASLTKMAGDVYTISNITNIKSFFKWKIKIIKKEKIYKNSML